VLKSIFPQSAYGSGSALRASSARAALRSSIGAVARQLSAEPTADLKARWSP
jgi:hypothetical protein